MECIVYSANGLFSGYKCTCIVNNIGNTSADTLTVEAATTFNNGIQSIVGNATVTGTTTTGTLGVTNNATVGGTLNVTGDSTLTGNLTANGNVTLGNATSDVVTITGNTNMYAGDGVGTQLWRNNTATTQYMQAVGVAANNYVDFRFHPNSTTNFREATFRCNSKTTATQNNGEVTLQCGTFSVPINSTVYDTANLTGLGNRAARPKLSFQGNNDRTYTIGTVVDGTNNVMCIYDASSLNPSMLYKPGTGLLLADSTN
jgi:hypothetical protein